MTGAAISRQLTNATASLKKRKIAADTDDDKYSTATEGEQLATFAPEVDHPDRQPSPSPASSSPPPHSTHSQGDNPSSPIRYIPPHLQSEFRDLLGRGGSPNLEAYAALSIEASNTSGSMSGSQDGDTPSHDGVDQDTRSSTVESGSRLGPKRSASPAKRSAADMEEGTAATNGSGAAPAESPMDADMSDAVNSDMLPPYTAIGTQDTAPITQEQITATLDEQVGQVMQLLQQSLGKGERGYMVSSKWLARVYARTSDKTRGMAPQMDFGKEALQGEIGPVDNSAIMEATERSYLKFANSELPYVPLKPGVDRPADYEILPEEAWNKVKEWYGLVQGQSPIVRFAVDTAPEGSTSENIQYELHPPVLTIRKALGGTSRQSIPPTPPATIANTSQVTTGNAMPDRESDLAVQLVASRQDRFQSFLLRSKRAAGVPMEHKVRTWRQLDPKSVSTDQPQIALNSMPTPATSRDASPSDAVVSPPQRQGLVLEPATFQKMEEGTDYELIDAKDETTNEKYNGRATLELLGLYADQTLILEEQIRGPAGGEFASDAKRKIRKAEEAKAKPNGTKSTTTSSGPVTRGRMRREGRARGTIGLVNLGNTCYMNSALQCISRVEELAYYFLEGKHKKEINGDNPLGYNGRMAKSYATFLEGLYHEGASVAFRPNGFKSQLAQAQPMFSGYGQQDSQEFLSFLVDALHEDLNRIHKKPYIENPDSDDATVHDPKAIMELGETYRTNHRARNDSIAMDLFNGFYKNTMVCPKCDKVSVTFDPYSLLTLQLPIENTWQHKVCFIPDKGQPSMHRCDVDKNASIRAFKDYFAKKVGGGVTANRLFVAEVFSNKIYKVFSEGDNVGEIPNTDVIVVYELPHQPSNISKPRNDYRSLLKTDPVPDMDSASADHMAVTVVNRRHEQYGGWKAVYQPMLIMVTREEAKDYDAILRKILVAASKLTSRNFLSEECAQPPQPTFRSRGDSTSGSAQVNEEAGHIDGMVSDRSVPSEDEYVNVSLPNGGSTQENDTSAATTTQTNDMSIEDARAEVLQPSSFISPNLRNLFEVRYFQSPGGDMQCATSNTSFDTFLMQDRVKQPLARRSSVTSLRSVQSRSSDGEMSTTRSGTTSVSDEDEATPEPDLVIGGARDDAFHGDVQSDDEIELPSVEQVNSAPSRFAKNGRKNKFGKKQRRTPKPKTYSKKGQRDSKLSIQPTRSKVFAREDDENDNPYYIRLAEGIMLDWTEEAWDALFGGDPQTPGDLRGSETVHKYMDPTQDQELEDKISKRQARKKHGISLDDCFAETAKTETLSEENAWYCGRCKELRRADKTLEIWTVPDILVVHLKRFSGERYRRDKVDILVDFPTEGLDLSGRVGLKEDGKECVYDLFAVDNHYGGLGGGHYTACAKNFFDGKWYDFNGKIFTTPKSCMRC